MYKVHNDVKALLVAIDTLQLSTCDDNLSLLSLVNHLKYSVDMYLCLEASKGNFPYPGYFACDDEDDEDDE